MLDSTADSIISNHSVRNIFIILQFVRRNVSDRLVLSEKFRFISELFCLFEC